MIAALSGFLYFISFLIFHFDEVSSPIIIKEFKSRRRRKGKSRKSKGSAGVRRRKLKRRRKKKRYQQDRDVRRRNVTSRTEDV
jgi:hypothetical protein